ncbi:MAG: TIM barrel protein [Planctomycetota bacterium]
MADPANRTDLAVTVGPLVRSGGVSVRRALDAIVAAGITGVQLDATLAGTRPRELDRRARQDLLALVRRTGLSLGGLDCFVPTAHLTAGPDLDRAVAALVAAVTLAADLGRTCLSFALPTLDETPRDALDAVLEAADAHAVPLALHAEHDLDALRRLVDSIGSPTVRVGVDAASCLIASREITATATADIGSLRLADARHDRDRQWQRCALGDGELDIPAAHIAAELTPRDGRPVVLDTSRVEHPAAAMREAVAAWQAHAPQLP